MTIERIPIAGITISERTLSDLKAVIERGLTTFVDVGSALLEIRDRRLYRETHGDFDNYCRERWGFSRQRAHQMIEAADIVEQLSTNVDARPTNEAQARELLRYEPEQRAEVWQSAVERHGERVTAAADIRGAVALPPCSPERGVRKQSNSGQMVTWAAGLLHADECPNFRTIAPRRTGVRRQRRCTLSAAPQRRRSPRSAGLRFPHRSPGTAVVAR